MPKVNYPIQTLDGAGLTSATFGLEELLAESAPAYGTEKQITMWDGSTGTFIYCYNPLTSVIVGGCVTLDFTGYTSTGGFYTPNISLPVTSAIMHIFGIATKTMPAAGGLWVQTRGRCGWARVDGGTNATLGFHLKAVNAAQYLTDSAGGSTRSTTDIAIFEGCRHGSAGTDITGWPTTSTVASVYPTLTAAPIYKIEETLAYNAQGYTTSGDPSGVIYLTGQVAAVA